LLTSDTDPGIGLPGDGVGGLVKAAAFWPLRCALDRDITQLTVQSK
jgi:hypothetical protein